MHIRPQFRRASAFSLIEVTMAIGIVAFAFVSIMGMLPVALNAFNRSVDSTIETQIAQRLYANAQQVKFSEIGTMAGGSVFDGEGNLVGAGTTMPAGGPGVYHAVVKPPTKNFIDSESVRTITIEIAKNRTVEAVRSDSPGDLRTYSFILADVGF